MFMVSRITSVVSLLFIPIFITGCASSSSLSTSSQKSDTDPIAQAVPASLDKVTYKDPDGSFEVKDGEIFSQDKKVGYVKNNIIYLQVHGKIIHFPGNLKDLSLGSSDFPPFNDGFSLYGLTFYPKYKGPYAVYKPVDPVKISYECNGPLVFNADGTPRPFAYCETNGKDQLSQYEYSGADSGFTTGAGYGEAWQKIYIKRLNGENLIFSASLSGQVILTTDASFGEIIEAYDSLVGYKLMSPDKIPSYIRTKALYSGDEHAKAEKELAPIVKEVRTVVASKAYLDLLLANPDTKQKLKVLDYYITTMSDMPVT